jgi:hypothetical protein
MAFNLKHFLRRVPPAMVRGLIVARHTSLQSLVDWADPTQTQPDRLFGAIAGLTQGNREAIIADLENADQLCNPIGQVALHSVVVLDARILSLLKSADSDEARSITLLLANETLFERALAAAYADRFRYGRSWSAFALNASAIPRRRSAHVQAFEAELATALARPDGSVGKLKIDSFERRASVADGKSAAAFVHYAIYCEGLPVSEIQFEGDELRRETRRPVHEGAILYDSSSRTIDVVAAGGKLVRNRIADSFAQNMLGLKGKIRPIVLRRLALDRLRRPMTFGCDPVDGIKSVKVTLLGLARLGGGFERVTIEVDPSDRTDICASSEQWFGDNDPLQWPDWRVTHATLRVVFHPEMGKTRDRPVSIQLRVPNSSNLRDQTLQHQVVSQKYLARWGLVAMSA